MQIKTAMVLAAGKGERMRPLTDACPKPMIVVAGKPMMDYSIDQLEKEKVQKIVVNVCHHGSMIVEHLENRKHPDIIFSPEVERLETGGGVLKALPHLGRKPFFVINGDILWSNKNGNTLRMLQEAWTDEMDALLLVVPLKSARGYDGSGDYNLTSSGKLKRRTDEKANYVYGGVQILHPRLFAGEETRAFSLNKLYDKAEERGTLFGFEHKSLWFHVGTPESLMETRAWFEEHSLIEA
ncbi:MAG: nucleotidyltransferase family protein [Alphaproteobacteria bacterium]